MIACVRLPFFIAQVELRDKPRLKPPLVILSALDQVLATCPQAAEAGVLPRLARKEAIARCPQATIIGGTLPYYADLKGQLVTILGRFANQVEVGEAGQALLGWLDLESQNPATARQVVPLLGQAIRDGLGLDPAIGIASGKFPAWAAATVTAPGKGLVIGPDRQTPFLAPLPITFLPLDADLAARLHWLGLTTLGQFAAIPSGSVMTQFGPSGGLLHRLARGDDPRPIQPYRPDRQEQVAYHFPDPVDDLQVINRVLERLAGDLAQLLQTTGQAAQQLWLFFEFEDASRENQHLTLRQPTSEAKRIAAVLQGFASQQVFRERVAGLLLIATELVPAVATQLDLFAHGRQSGTQLQTALDALVTQYGPAAFYWVQITDQTAWLLEQRVQVRRTQAA